MFEHDKTYRLLIENILERLPRIGDEACLTSPLTGKAAAFISGGRPLFIWEEEGQGRQGPLCGLGTRSSFLRLSYARLIERWRRPPESMKKGFIDLI